MLIIKEYRSIKSITLPQSNKITSIKLSVTKFNIFQGTFCFSLLTLILLTSCSPTRRIQDGDYLLAKTKINIDKKEIEKSELKKYEKQTANRRILGFKFHLFLYNLASPKKQKFPSKWLREIGEAPIIWDPLLTKKTNEQFQKYLENKGYYENQVHDSVFLKKKRAKVKHNIILNEPTIINSINYEFEDPDIAFIVLNDTVNRLFNKGKNFDKELLQQERLRIEEFLKNRGYYKFLKEYIFFEAIEGTDKKKIDLTILIKDNVYGEIDRVTKIRKHRRHKINHVYIYPDFIQSEKKGNDKNLSADTVESNSNFVIYTGKHTVKPNAVIAPNQSEPGQIYNLNKVRKTYSNYTSLPLYRIANITFKNIEQGPDTSEFKYLNSYIELSPRKKQAFTYEIVGTISNKKDLGAQLNITYNNYNIFGGAEHLQFKLTGLVEMLRKNDIIMVSDSQLIYIAGAETNITFPKFVAPFRADKFTKKFYPKTNVNVAYKYQKRLEFTSTSANASFGYIWKGNSYNRNLLIPLEFSYVWLPYGIDEYTRARFENTSMINKFYDHAIVSARYQFEYTNQIIEKPSNYVFLRLNVETAGNFIKGAMSLTNWNDSLFGVEYYQFVRSDIDLRFNNQINRYNRVVFRLYGGIGLPYGNNSTLPFEKMYSSGDANGLRAWGPYTLGPGNVDTSYSYVMHLGDVKLEGNIEYRFDLFWKLEGALFLDVGNTWTINDHLKRPEAEFNWEDFYNDLAIGTGIGLRFDFTFLLIRTDFGFKLRDPSISQGSKWIDANKTSFNSQPFWPRFWDRWNFQFALGYPF